MTVYVKTSLTTPERIYISSYLKGYFCRDAEKEDEQGSGKENGVEADSSLALHHGRALGKR